jgi:hypothetical protein
MIPIVDMNEQEKEQIAQDLKQLETPKTDKEAEEAAEVEIFKNDKGDEVTECNLSASLPKNKTKELLHFARQSASQKLAAFIPNTAPEASNVSSSKKVLFGPESPAFSVPVKKCQLLPEKQHSKPRLPEATPATPIKLFTNNCAECGLKMTLLKPFNCARCRRSFCPEHAPRSFSGLSFELFIEARWMKVCESCHFEEGLRKRRPDNPTSRSLFGYFSQVRAEFQDFKEIEATRLQRRLEKLADFDDVKNSAAAAATTTTSNKFSTFERQIVPWQADKSSSTCPFCEQPFTLLQRRKHHCRLCGRLACQDCLASRRIPLRLRHGQVEEIKNCKTCHLLLFRPKLAPMPPALTKLNQLYQVSLARLNMCAYIILLYVFHLLLRIEDGVRSQISDLGNDSKIQ